MNFTFWLIGTLIILHEFSEMEDCLAFLDQLAPDEFRELYEKFLLRGVDDDEKPRKITMRLIRSMLEETFVEYSGGQEKLLLQLMENPADWKLRIVETLKTFHELYFLPLSETIGSIAAERLPQINRRLKENPRWYLDTICVGHYSTLFLPENPPQIYAGYAYDRGLGISVALAFIVFGMQRENLVLQVNKEAQTNLLFQALSDQKRIDILRMVSKRPWYGKELASHFKLTTATMSYHLNRLVNAGLLRIEVGEQKRIYYTLNREMLEQYFSAARFDLLEEK